MTDLEKSQKITVYIDRYMRKNIDKLIYNLEDKFGYQFSRATENYVALLSLEYIKRLNDTLSSQYLKEPEEFSYTNIQSL